MKKVILLLSFIGIAVISYCQQSGNTNSNSTPEIECMGVELDGSHTLRAWGVGRNKTDAIEQAMKNALNAVLFRGIHSGDKSCNVRPLVMEVNAQEKYEYYFNIFFKDGGDYKKYVTTEDKRPLTNAKENTKTQVKYGITVRVLRSELKQRLIEDEIIKP